MTKRLREMSEWELISRLGKWLGKNSITMGIGDDAAGVEIGGDIWLFSSDAQVENSHFLLKVFPPRIIGRRAAIAGLSDIWAKGGRPKYLLLSLGLPPDMEWAWVREVYRGVKGLCDELAVEVIGGDTVKSGTVWIDVMSIGTVERACLKRQSTARPGNKIYVTGWLGGAYAAGYAYYKKDRKAFKELRAAWFCPPLRNKMAQWLASLPTVTAMTDLSDGLARDLRKLCRQSGVGARINLDGLPVAEPVKRWAERWQIDHRRWAVVGGEDYELLFTTTEPLAERYLSYEGLPITLIGEIIKAGKISFLGRNLPSNELDGYDQFVGWEM